MKILLDTNVMIAGFLSRKGPPGEILQLWLDGYFQLVTSQIQLDELRRALGYEKLRDRIDPAQIQDFVDNIDVMAMIVSPAKNVSVSPDPDDNLILSIAVAARADLIVSGDRAGMLDIKRVENIPIVSPREALASIKTQCL